MPVTTVVGMAGYPWVFQRPTLVREALSLEFNSPLAVSSKVSTTGCEWTRNTSCCDSFMFWEFLIDGLECLRSDFKETISIFW